MALHVLRKVKQEVLDSLQHPAGPNPKTEPPANELYLDAVRPWFKLGYVADAFPRHAYVTKELMDGTEEQEGFAVWEDENGVVATFDTHKEAYAAMAGARTTLQVKVAIPEKEPAPEEPAGADESVTMTVTDAAESRAVPV